MIFGFHLLLCLLRTLFLSRTQLAAENLALRQQLIVLQRSLKRPKLRQHDRIFWVWLSRVWSQWSSVLLIVQPSTVVSWHRQGFRLYWRWKSRNLGGRPKVDREVRALIRRMCRDNPTWGAPRICSELRLLGFTIAESTVAKYMIRSQRPRSTNWKDFLDNHVSEFASMDFFTVPTATFRVLYCLVVLRHDRRYVVHYNVTASPTSQWISQQLVEAFPFEEAPRFLLRDQDGKYGKAVLGRIKSMGIQDTPTSPASPWQNPYVERLIGSIRRECLNHFIILNEAHLKRILGCYFEYYHRSRPHLSLDRNSPEARVRQHTSEGAIVSLAKVGGLHHEYRRAA